MRHWSYLNASLSLPPTRRVSIKIHDFPVDFWHPTYFRQAITGMGTLAGIPADVARGDNKAFVQLSINCHDVLLIPYTLMLGHDGKWTSCRVELEGRQDPLVNGEGQPSLDQGNDDGNDEGVNHHHGLATAYMSIWKRRPLRFPPLYVPARRGAPAARVSGLVDGCVPGKGKPGSQVTDEPSSKIK